MSHIIEKESKSKKTKNLKDKLDPLLIITMFALFFGVLGSKMGVANLFKSMMETAYGLLMETAFYIMAIAVLTGAVGKIAVEFGIVNLLNKIFSPLMKPLYNLPGVAFLGVITTYLSDNPAIIVLANDKTYLSYFEEEKIPCLCNLGTSFGMGLILTTFMMSQGYLKEALIGNLGAVIGSIVSVRLMYHKVCKEKGISKDDIKLKSKKQKISYTPEKTEGTFFIRLMTAILEGGKVGVEMGVAIIPGLLIICTIIMMLTFGPADPNVGYQGLAFEGVAVLPKLGEILSPIVKPLFGFSNPEAIAFPITSLGAVGAALSLVPKFLDLGLIGGNEIAVFTAMGMCWSGYLSTHVSMMDALRQRELISHAISSHTIGGIVAGISAHFITMLLL